MRTFFFIWLCICLVSINLSSSYAVLTLPTATCSGYGCRYDLTSNSDYYSWTVPAGVISITATVQGGGGGTGNWSNNERAPGGKGALLTETITVNAGDILYFYVGGLGGDAVPGVGGTGGSNAAGSSGGNGGGSGSGGGGGGGGASEIRKNGTAISNRIVVAGGGGGGGSGCGTVFAADQIKDSGGNASGNTGGAGLCTGYAASNAGSGATITADGKNGTSRIGRSPSSYGGGGGGGYYGGGAGTQGGGGAGSSWIESTSVSGSFGTASTVSAGSISFTYAITPLVLTNINVNSGNSGTYRTSQTITATTSAAGYVTFLANGKRIPNCIKIQTISLVATCNYRSSIHGSVLITSLLYALRSDSSAVSTITASGRSSSRSNQR